MTVRFREPDGTDPVDALDMALALEKAARERISVVPEEFATITQGSKTWTEPYKQCPHCSSHVLESFAFCPKCGHEFARRPLGKTGTFLANETCADGE